MFSRSELEAAGRVVRAVMPPTPQYAWPLLRQRLGVDVVVKHENHTPVGAFKVRGGLTFVDRLRNSRRQARGLISATRGNHGQSIALAGARAGLPVTIVVPRGNSPEKNAAMRALGAELIEIGEDFDEARQALPRLADRRGYFPVPSFHPDLVVGVATYAHELFIAEPHLDAVFVPIGLGSGICGVIRVRDLLGLTTRVIGVVSERANAYAESFRVGERRTTATAQTFADGIATRQPELEALGIISEGADGVLEVTEEEIAEAIRILHEDTHNLAEGAGAAGLAGLVRDRGRWQGKRCAAILCGGNLDRQVAAEVLAGRTPSVPH